MTAHEQQPINGHSEEDIHEMQSVRRRCHCWRLLALPAQAANIVDEWASMKAPAAPELKPVTVDAKDDSAADARFHEPELWQTAALPRHDSGDEEAARARRAPHKVPVVYSIIANSTPADVITDVAPHADEPHVLSGPDKFLRTDLEKILKDKGITTVIVVGTASNGAVLYTGERRGVSRHECHRAGGWPVVGRRLSPTTATALAPSSNAPLLSAKTTLTKSDMIKF